MRTLVVGVVLVVAAGSFALGRASVDRRSPTPRGSYSAGREDAFSGFDGGWILGRPYIVTLAHGGPGITYRFARRWPVDPGREYRVCSDDIICSRPG